VTGVLLVTFGSAVTADQVPAYLASVRAGRAVPAELISEFQRRYARIGRSPLLDITAAQAVALQRALDADHGANALRVAVGMLHAAPFIGGAVEALVHSGATAILAVLLAPQYSSIILGGYERAIGTARAAHPAVDIRIARAWHDTDEWIECLHELVAGALARLPAGRRDTIPVIFTAHSLPRAVVDRDPGYIDQLRWTAESVAHRAGLDASRWQFAYQSAGHTPEPWLTPDVKDLLPGLRAANHRDVLVVPVQFLADHLEILYDIDVAAAEEAERAGITLHRIEMPNTSPLLISALEAVVKRELDVHVQGGGAPLRERRHLGAEPERGRSAGLGES